MWAISSQTRLGWAVRAIALGLVQLSVPVTHLEAAPVTWNGGGDPDCSWMNSANWAGNVVPTPGIDDLHFAGSTGPVNSNTFAAGTQFSGLIFDPGAAAFTLGGNQLNLAGNLVNNSSNLQTVNLPLNVVGNRNINAGSAGLSLAGLAGGSGAGQVITLLGTGGAIAGPINASGLRIQQNASTGGSDSDTWSFVGNNTSSNTGQFVLSRGVTNFGSATDAPNIKIIGARFTNSDFFIIGDSGVAGAASTFNMVAGTLTLDGAGGNPLVTLGNSAASQVVWNQSGGTVALQNFVSNSMLLANQIGSTTRFNLSGGAFDTGAYFLDIAVRGDGQVNISGAGTLKTPRVGLNRGSDSSAVGEFNLNGRTLQVGTIQSSNSAGIATFDFNGGTLVPIDSQRITFSQNTSNPISANVQAGGAVIDTNGATVTINVPLRHNPALGATLDGGLTKNGPGTLLLSKLPSSSQLYTGPTTINGGTLRISNTGQLGSGPIVDNGTLSVLTQSNFAAPIFTALPNAISGSGGLSASSSNSGMLTLSGANTYLGPT